MVMQMVMIMLMAMAMAIPFTDLWELDAMHLVLCGNEDDNGNANAHDNGHGMPFTL